MRGSRILLIFFAVLLIARAATVGTRLAVAASYVTITEGKNGRFDVKFGGTLFTSLHTRGVAKPFLYPLIGPHGIRMTRDYPMKKGTTGEASDHPHHQSLWFTHGDVNGVSFWHLGKKSGKIITTRVEKPVNHGAEAWIVLHNKWIDANGATICTDRQKLIFRKYRRGAGGSYAMIDYQIDIAASEGDVVFGDTKEGTMGIRTNPKLRIDRGAQAVNSEGVKGSAIWGKRAKWVDYSATINDKPVGIAIFDHPKNPRHPTWWHARAYGLVAANPFGIHDFERKKGSPGDMTVEKGKTVTFNYRFVVHEGDATRAEIAKRFSEWTE